MTQLDFEHEHHIDITQVSEVVPIDVVQREIGRLMTGKWSNVGPVVGTLNEPDVSTVPERRRIRDIVYDAVSPKRPVNLLNNADTVFPKTREHDELFAESFVGPRPLKPEEKRIAREGRGARRAVQRGKAAVRLSGHHY